ncbi:MAG: hypothetical protein K2N90_03425 [Lachnospiraceae bacterium]|nr:hypothetical protein [Lachnospiraceae bacterium]
MIEKMQEKYYLIKFKILENEYYTFWYTDDVDGFLMEHRGTLKSFPTKEEAIIFAEEKGFELDTDELIISSAILRRMNIRKIRCNLFLNCWNTLSDVAHSMNCQFLGDNREGIVQDIYVKLFYGCNILVKEDEEHYHPKWSKKERRWIAKVMRNGFKILSEGII